MNQFRYLLERETTGLKKLMDYYTRTYTTTLWGKIGWYSFQVVCVLLKAMVVCLEDCQEQVINCGLSQSQRNRHQPHMYSLCRQQGGIPETLDL